MERLDEARITLLVDGIEHSSRESDGRIEGGLTDLNDVLLIVELPREFWMFGLMVDGKKNVTMARNHGEEVGETLLHRVKITVKLANSERYAGQYHTEYDQNNIRIIVFNEDMSVELWEITLLAHEGVFYLRQQRVYEARLFQKNGCLVTDHQSLNNWPGMLAVISGVLGESVTELPVYPSESEHVNGRKAEGLDPKHGCVEWYNDANGFGAVLTNAGMMRVHRTGIKANGFPELRTGQTVTWDQILEPQQTSKRKTAFDGELRGVRVIG